MQASRMDERPTIEVLYQDAGLLAVMKPAGMLVHRDAASRVFEHVLLNTVRDQVGAYLYPVHRLDRNTSGVVLFGLSSEAARVVQASLGDADAEKSYLALVRGQTPAVFESDRPLRNTRGEPCPAVSRFETLACFETSSLVRVRISTGRHHQIRRHLNHLAHHVIGDTTHGKGGINRQYRAEFGLPPDVPARVAGVARVGGCGWGSRTADGGGAADAGPGRCA